MNNDGASHPTLRAMTRELPHNAEAEAGVLGSVLTDNAVLPEVVAVLPTEGPFYLEPNRLVYRAVLDLWRDGEPAVPLTVSARLEAAGLAAAAGGDDHLGDLCGAVPHSANAVYFAGIVRQKALAREAMEAAEGVLLDGYSNRYTGEELLGRALDRLRGVEVKGGAKTFRVAESLPEAYAKIRDRERGVATGVRTGFHELDGVTDGFQPGEFVVLAGRPSMGKAQPLDAKVLTPSGFVPMGSLRVGDVIASSSGGWQRVVGVFPQGELPVYRVTMTDDGTTECCEDHLWFTQTRNERRTGSPGSVKRLKDIARTLGRGSSDVPNHALPMVAPVEFAGQNPLRLHPYALGLLLGDGSFGSVVQFDKPEADIQRALDALTPAEDRLQLNADGKGGRIRRAVRNNDVSETRKALDAYGLTGRSSTEKFIPPDYLRASPADRLDLLRGLLDTEGYVRDGGQSVEYPTSSPRLAEDVAFLARSLGAVVRTTSRVPVYSYLGEKRTGADAYRLSIWFPDGTCPVSSEKHLAKWVHGTPRYRRSFRSIEFAGYKPCQCIKVSAPDQLYVTDDFIVTHNTSFALNVLDFVAVECGVPALFVSLEMSNARLTTRLMIARARVDGHKVRLGEGLTDPEWGRIDRAYAELAQAPLYLTKKPGRNAAQVANEVRLAHAREGIRFAAVDYLQLMRGDNPRDNEVQALTKITALFQGLASELEIPVLMLSQLNRSLESREDPTPRMADLRGSGSIENDADYVLLLHRPEYFEPGVRVGEADVIVAKSRDGRVGSFPVAFDKPLMRFRDIYPDAAPEATPY